MSKVSLKSSWDSNGNLTFAPTGAANTASLITTCPVIGGTQDFPKTTVTTKTSAAGYTMTAAQVLGGLTIDTTTSTGGLSVPMPTVAAIVALIPGWIVGTSFQFIYENPGTNGITIATDASSQWTMVNTMTIASLNAKLFICVISSATTGTVYSIGTFIC